MPDTKAAAIVGAHSENQQQLAETERWKLSAGRLAPVQALLMQREYLNLFSQPDVVSLLGEAGLEKTSGPGRPNPT